MNTKYALLAVVLVAVYVLYVRGSNPFAQAAQSARAGSPAGGIV